ncbi:MULTISPECIES: hypothetical protein [unclassified Sphingomonas]|uniref:hypothetical protein n=1 Tax=unclassified Sphingomonas TaxID=196159 RepID=UPI00082F6360|nr:MULTISPECIES: hypothetical protein [unclassified Sphingomonas]
MLSWLRTISVIALFIAPPAMACSMGPIRSETGALDYARQSYGLAALVVDAEVEKPMNLGDDWKPGLLPAARLKILRVLKPGGPGIVEGSSIAVAYLDSCSIAFTRVGQRVRILLDGGGMIFVADSGMNGAAIWDAKLGALFDREIDRLAGVPRPTGLDPLGAE